MSHASTASAAELKELRREIVEAVSSQISVQSYSLEVGSSRNAYTTFLIDPPRIANMPIAIRPVAAARTHWLGHGACECMLRLYCWMLGLLSHIKLACSE